jgi:hypothetical protein
MQSGESYHCARCEGIIWHTEGTALLDGHMMCAACATAAMVAATPNAGAPDTVRPDTVRPDTAPPPTPVAPAGAGTPPAASASVRTRPRWRPWRRSTGMVAALAVILAAILVAAVLAWAPWKPPATPKGIEATSTPTTVTLAWHARSEGSPVGRYLVVRNGVEVGSASRTSFVDIGLAPGGVYTYQVIAARGSKRSAASPPLRVSTTAPPPTQLEQRAVTPHSVTLGWSPPADAPAPNRYIIQADGNTLDTVEGTFPSTPSDEITGLASGTTYALQVQAVWDAGGVSQPSAMLSVTTPDPPVSDARLDAAGGVPVHFKMTASNVPSLPVGKEFTNNWTLTPQCPSGPCNVVLVGDFDPAQPNKTFQLTLTRNGATYTGHTQTDIFGCLGKDYSTPLSVTITVSAASGPDWVASQWSGTIEDDNPNLYPGGSTYCPRGRTIASIASAGQPGDVT